MFGAVTGMLKNHCWEPLRLIILITDRLVTSTILRPTKWFLVLPEKNLTKCKSRLMPVAIFQ